MTSKFDKLVLISVLVFSLAVAGGAVAETSLGMKQFTSIDEVANAITSYFPKVQGFVTNVQDGTLTVSIGTKDGLAVGTELTLWRDAAEIRHPVTGAVIGRTEDEVGSMVVTKPGDVESTGTIIKKILVPRPGDKARITPRKIPLALLPLRVERPDIMQGLAERLKASSRFILADSAAVDAFLADKKERDAALIKAMGKALGLEAVVTIEIYPAADGKYLVTAGLYYADDARPLDTLVAMLDLRSKADVLGEVKPFFAPPREEKGNIADLPFSAQLLAAADYTGSGSLQYAFSDGGRVHVYRRETAGWHETWAEPALPAGVTAQILNLDAADASGNGVPELFVTVMRNQRVESYALEFRDGLFHHIADLPGFLRVISYPGKGTVLLGMAYDPKTFYGGMPHQLVWAGGGYVAGPELKLPDGVGFYGFEFASVGEAAPLLFALDGKNRITAYSGTSRIWKSEDEFLTVGMTVYKPVIGLGAVLNSTDPTDSSLKVRIPGRMLAFDMNGDGREELIVPKNKGSMIGDFSKGELVGLGWTGARLEQRWQVDDPHGVVMDLQIVRQPGAAPEIATLVMTPGGLFGKDTFSVVNYPAQ